ncbi:MAG: hypothetical protein ACI4CS_07045 [Candidatus Weimeria sp.]
MMNKRIYKSVRFMQAINPLLAEGKISNEDAVFLVGEYKKSNDQIIKTFLENVLDGQKDSNVERIEAFLTQD